MLDRNPNGKFEIIGIGDLVTVQEPFGCLSHGTIAKISRKNKEGITPVYIRMRYTNTTRKVASWYVSKGWQDLTA